MGWVGHTLEWEALAGAPVQAASVNVRVCHCPSLFRSGADGENSKALGGSSCPTALPSSPRLANLPAMRRPSQVDIIRKVLVASVAVLLYVSPRDFACSANLLICVCINSV